MAEIVLEHKSISPSNPGRVALTAKRDDETLYMDSVDLTRLKQRQQFVEGFLQKYPGLESQKETIEKQILHLAGRLLESKSSDSDKGQEVDVSNIVRPHLFYTGGVCGLLVPSLRLVSGKPQGHWLQYLQYADGRRECKELASYLTLSDERRLWFSPLPSEPGLKESCNWSRQSQQRWLAGYSPDLGRIVKSLLDAFNYFLEFPQDEAKGCLATLSLWTILSYVYPCWAAIPYLSIGGPKGSGKSRIFDTLMQLAFKPIASSSITASCLFRTLDSRGGTLLFDEAERLRSQGPETADINSILLAGYKANQTAQRNEKVGDTWKPVAFDVYGPKALAAINELPPALASRCIRITMFRAPKSSIKPKRRIDGYDHWQSITDDLYCAALAYGKQFHRLARELIDCEGLYCRDLEIWGPLIQIARFLEAKGVEGFSGLVEDHARLVANQQSEDSVPHIDEAVLQSLVKLRELNPHGVRASDILSDIQEDQPGVFTKCTSHLVGRILKRYGLHSTRSMGKSFYRPNDVQLHQIQDSYSINLGFDTPVQVH